MTGDRAVADTEAAERFRRVDAVFDALLDLPADLQAQEIESLCARDALLGNEVRELLRAHAESEGFLESAAAAIVAPLLAAAGTHVGPTPARAGPFRLVREIGRGGMGSVHLGERDDGQFEQRVAVKLIGRVGPGVQHRFATERRILARLEHNGIARLIDGGMADGRPYFAMELVAGEPIDTWCAARAASLDTRLDLFAQVCAAVAYAHRHLVIHRDLKPSNILVTAEGQVKLLDFGIATLLDNLPDDVVEATEPRVLTPEFAAPEQVLGRSVTTAADVYSLGVLLYVLMAGVRPYDVRGRTAAEIERIVCDDEPSPPSARATPPWRRRLRGDLDAIVMKAMRKEPADRYASVDGLLADIERHRSGRPVRARRLTAAYRARRFVARHRWGAAGTAILAAVTTTYVVGMSVQQRRLTDALADARSGAERAEQVTGFMLGLFEASERGSAFADTLTARALLARGAALARDMAERPEVQAQMLDAMGRLYMQLGEYAAARASFEEALAARTGVLDAEHADVATSLDHLAASQHALGATDSSVALYRRALDVRRRRLGRSDPATLETLYSLATVLHVAGDHAMARRHFDEWRSLVAAQPVRTTPARAQQHVLLGQLMLYGGDHDAALELLTAAVRMRTELYGERHPAVARTISILGGAYVTAGRLVEAERAERHAVELMRAAYPDGHPELARTIRGLAVVLHRQKVWAEAEQLYVEVRTMVGRFHGTDHVVYASASEDLGMLLRARGHYARAEPYLREALELYRRHASGSLLTHRAGVLLGDVLLAKGDTAAAEPLLAAGYEALATQDVPGFSFASRVAAHALMQLHEGRGSAAEAARYRDAAR